MDNNKENLIVPAESEQIANLRDFIVGIGVKYGFSAKLINAFKLAIDEAATNIIEHAYCGEEGYITIQAIIEKNCLTIKIIDQGEYFHPNWAEAPSLQQSIDAGEKPSLGIFLIQKLIDEIGYEKTDTGNELSLTKYDKPPAKKLSFEFLASKANALRKKYSIPILALYTLFILAGFAIYYMKADEKVYREFQLSGVSISKQIAEDLSDVDWKRLELDEAIDQINGIIQPIQDKKIGQIYSIAIDDTSGNVIWSTISTEIQNSFPRPEEATQIADNIYEYSIRDGMNVLEIEHTLSNENAESALHHIHVMLAKNYAESNINKIRLDYLKITSVILALSFLLFALSSYLIIRPLQKLYHRILRGKIGPEVVDSKTEITEITNAFNDFIEKFKESQKDLAQQERVAKEFELAENLQKSLLPKTVPDLKNYQIATCYEAAQSVSGDFYDFFEVDNDRIGVVVADVAGKSFSGSLVMGIIRTALRTEARGIKDAAEVLHKVNEFVGNDLKNGTFVTVLYLIIDTKRHIVNFASAGHSPLILYRGKKRQTFYLNSMGFPIGVQLPDKDFFSKHVKSTTLQLAPKDTLLLYTDGITQAISPNNHIFGEERLFQFIQEDGGAAVNKVAEKLKKKVFSFAEEEALFDDMTFVMIRNTATAKEFKNVVDQTLAVEAQFLSIDEITRLLNAISHYPELDETTLSKKLNTKKYGHLQIDPEKLRALLARMRLHSRQHRLEFIKYSKLYGRQGNPPGTPKLSLAGKAKIQNQKIKGPLKHFEKYIRPEPEIVEEKIEPIEEVLPIEPISTVPEPNYELESAIEKETPADVIADEATVDEKDVAYDEVEPKPTPLFEFEEQDVSDTLIDEIFRSQETELEEVSDPQETETDKFEIAESEELLSKDDSTEIEAEPSGAEEKPVEPIIHAEHDDSTEERILIPAKFEHLESEADSLLGSNLVDLLAAQKTDSVLEQPPETEKRSQIEKTVTDAEFSFSQHLSNGLNYYKKKQYKAAINDFKASIRLKPKYAQGYMLLANSYFRHEMPVDALSTLEQLKKLTDFNDKVRENIALVYMKIDLPQSAIREWEAILINQSERIDLIEKIKKARQILDDDFEIANTEEDNESEDVPEAPSIKTQQESSISEPVGPEQDSKNGKKESEIKKYLNEAIKTYQANDFEGSITALKTLILEYPKTPAAYKLLGNILFRSGNLGPATKAYKFLQQLEADNFSDHENMGLIYAKNGSYKKAMEEWQKALNHSPQRSDLKQKIEQFSQLV